MGRFEPRLSSSAWTSSPVSPRHTHIEHQAARPHQIGLIEKGAARMPHGNIPAHGFEQHGARGGERFVVVNNANEGFGGHFQSCS